MTVRWTAELLLNLKTNFMRFSWKLGTNLSYLSWEHATVIVKLVIVSLTSVSNVHYYIGNLHNNGNNRSNRHLCVRNEFDSSFSLQGTDMQDAAQWCLALFLDIFSGFNSDCIIFNAYIIYQFYNIYMQIKNILNKK